MGEYKIFNSKKQLMLIFRDMLASAIKSYTSGYSLFKKQLSVERSKSKFGFIWDLGEPFVLAIVFALLYQFKAIDGLDSGLPYALFVISGIMLWQSIVDSITAPLSNITRSKELLLNTHIMPESLMWSEIIRSVYKSLYKYLVVLIFAIYFQQTTLFSAVLAFILMLITVSLFTSIGFMLAPFNSVSEDVSRVVQLILRPLLFLSGVLFSVDHIEAMAVFNEYNIFFIAIDFFRSVFFNLTSFSLVQFLIFILAFSLYFLVSWHVFRVSIKIIVDRG